MTKNKAMAEVKKAPKPKTENAPGQTREITPRPLTTLMRSNGNAFAVMRRFAHEMDHLFEDLGLESGWHLPRLLSRGRELLRREAGFVPAEWSPRVDLVEGEGQFVVRADLPGMSRDDITVDVSDDVITIQGERKQQKKEEREG